MRLHVIMGQYPPAELERRQKAVLNCASPGTEIEFKQLPGSFFMNQSGAVAAARMTPEICRTAIESEKDGADAVVTFGTLDPGVEAAAHLVDIPVLGAGRTGYNIASMLGRRIGVLVYVESSVAYSRRLIESFGVKDKVVMIKAANIGLRDSAAKASSGETRERLIELGLEAVRHHDVEVLFPQGVSMVPLHCSAADLSAAIGIPVVDGLAASIKMAEYFVAAGVKNSRVAYPRLDS